VNRPRSTGPHPDQPAAALPLTRRDALRALSASTLAVGCSGLLLPESAAWADGSQTAATALHRVRFHAGSSTGPMLTETGRILVTAADGGLLLESRAGQLWTITPDQLIEQAALDEAFQPLTPDRMAESLIQSAADLGADGPWEVHHTSHWTIASAAGRPLAQWAGALLERLFNAFHAFWKTRDLPLHEPELPLPVLILANRDQFAAFATADGTPGSAQGQGYYRITANRVVLFDLTATDRQPPPRSIAEAQQRARTNLASVSAVIHEATHQVAFNTGLHRRFADNPVWFTEGLAMYFETPDLASRTGWRTIGRTSPGRLRQFVDYARKRRQADSLETLVRDNQRFAAPELALDAYAEAWLLTHLLLRTRSAEFTRYSQRMAAKPLLRWDEPETRLAEFREAFEGDLERDLGRHVERLGRT